MKLKGKKIKLNIGCGEDLRRGYINLDCHKGHGADRVYSLPKIVLKPKDNKYTLEVDGESLPYKDNSVDEILCFHVLEDFSYEYPTILFDFNRVLKKGGILHIKIPYGLSTCNINHIRTFDEFAFSHFKINTTDTPYEAGNHPLFKLISLKVNRQNHLVGKIVAKITSKSKMGKQLKGKGKDKFRKDHKFLTKLYRFFLGLSFKKHEIEVILQK